MFLCAIKIHFTSKHIKFHTQIFFSLIIKHCKLYSKQFSLKHVKKKLTPQKFLVLTKHIYGQTNDANVQQSIFLNVKIDYPFPNIKTTFLNGWF
jgi:hypothetical protein